MRLTIRASGEKVPMGHDLLLAEELLLLSLDDEKGSDQAWSGLDPGLAGALLLELTEADALRVDGEGDIVPGAVRPTDSAAGRGTGRRGLLGQTA
jgi:hypothetical protein